MWPPSHVAGSEHNVTMTLEAIKYNEGRLEILNQLLLPAQSVYEHITSVDEAWEAIRSMKVGWIAFYNHDLIIKNCTEISGERGTCHCYCGYSECCCGAEGEDVGGRRARSIKIEAIHSV